MDRAKFEALLPFIVAALLQKIIERKKMSQDEAFSALYGFGLYLVLDEEETKVWHYSTEKLFQLFDEEMGTLPGGKKIMDKKMLCTQEVR